MEQPISTPITKIGVIGGGQLAWMMGPAAQKLGLELVVQTPQETDPAVAIAQASILSPVADWAATATLAAQCDVITFENEFIDCQGLQTLADQGTRFRPGLDVLALVLDKRHQREFFSRIGLPNPRYTFLDGNENAEELMAKAEAIGFPLVIKTRRLGYDGYGTAVIPERSQLSATWDRFNHAPVLLEEFVPFKQELAIMVARSALGDVAIYPTVETQQVEQICRRVFAPARVSAAVAARMEAIARTLVEQLQLVGLIGIECFLTQDDQVLINEIAPRTHNSGHYTLEACETSQFEQQLRAIEAGVYNHIPGDGRHQVVTDPAAVKVRAEDGRSIAGVDISPFIGSLPQGKSTQNFSTPNASGSTSQAANMIEAIEAGATALLVDEDTSATNFMIRDRRMQALIAKDREPITPFVDKVRQLYTDYGISTVLVMGGSGDYFDVADTVIALDEFCPQDVTQRAQAIAAEYQTDRDREGGPCFGTLTPRIIQPDSIDPSQGRHSVKLRARDVDQLQIGTEAIDLSAVEQLVEPGQVRAIAAAIVYAQRYHMTAKTPLAEAIAAVMADLEQYGLDCLTDWPMGDLVSFRGLELGAAINRLRTLTVSHG